MKFTLATPYIKTTDYVALAVEAEACGFDVVAVGDHVANFKEITNAYAHSEEGERLWGADSEWPDVFTILSFLAAKTERIELMTSIVVLPMRHPLVVAQQVSTISELSRRKFRLGIGVGWSTDEFRMMHEDFKNRGKRCNEQIEIMRKVWQGGVVEHHGQYYDFNPLVMLPTPAAEVSIIAGAAAEAGLRRAARLCDGWISPPAPVETSIQKINLLRAMLKVEGRENDPFELTIAAADWQTDPDTIKKAEDAGVDNVLIANPWLEEAFIPGGTEDNTDLQTKKDGVRRFADLYIAPRR